VDPRIFKRRLAAEPPSAEETAMIADAAAAKTPPLNQRR